MKIEKTSEDLQQLGQRRIGIDGIVGVPLSFIVDACREIRAKACNTSTSLTEDMLPEPIEVSIPGGSIHGMHFSKLTVTLTP